MPNYIVEVRGEAREVYSVEADNEADAMKRWHEGSVVVTEVSSCEPVSAVLDDA